MKLTGHEIQRRMETGMIQIKPFIPEHMGPNSYDLRLSPELLVYKTTPSTTEIGTMGTHNINIAKLVRAEVMQRDTEPDAWEPIELSHNWCDVLDMAVDTPTYSLKIPQRGLVLVPGRLYLGSTIEWTETHDCVPCIEGRSSVGRLGINIHSTAGFGDIGFCGNWTLEISVIEPVRVYAGMRICQIHYDPVMGEITHQYASQKYQHQTGPRPSGLWKEFADGTAIWPPGSQKTTTKPG